VVEYLSGGAQAVQPGNPGLDEFFSSVNYLTPLECAIRRFCRWFEQSGPDACRICPFLFNHIWPIEYDKEQK
jgi:hypothetical protein